MHEIEETKPNGQEKLSFSIETFSQGKTPQRNEDRLIATHQYISVIDGATANPPLEIENECKKYTSGEFASATISDIIEAAPPNLFGKALVNYITAEFNIRLNLLSDNTQDALSREPFRKPYAALTVATIIEDKIVITQLGDVGFRINGKDVFVNPKEIDLIHARMRVNAIEKAKTERPNVAIDEL